MAHARALGLDVVVTDHHLPAKEHDIIVLPDATVIVNPNQPDCGFASKHLAGVGVMFYVLLALRTELRERGVFSAETQPRLDVLLDLVALGTVADVVKLDANNRRLVAQGLKRIRAGKMQPGVAALFTGAGRDPRRASVFDFGFASGRASCGRAGSPHVRSASNACLPTTPRATELAPDAGRHSTAERRDVESGMREQAQAMLEALMPEGDAPAALANLRTPNSTKACRHRGLAPERRCTAPPSCSRSGKTVFPKGSGRSIAGFICAMRSTW